MFQISLINKAEEASEEGHFFLISNDVNPHSLLKDNITIIDAQNTTAMEYTYGLELESVPEIYENMIFVQFNRALQVCTYIEDLIKKYGKENICINISYHNLHFAFYRGEREGTAELYDPLVFISAILNIVFSSRVLINNNTQNIQKNYFREIKLFAKYISPKIIRNVIYRPKNFDLKAFINIAGSELQKEKIANNYETIITEAGSSNYNFSGIGFFNVIRVIAESAKHSFALKNVHIKNKSHKFKITLTFRTLFNAIFDINLIKFLYLSNIKKMHKVKKIHTYNTINIYSAPIHMAISSLDIEHINHQIVAIRPVPFPYLEVADRFNILFKDLYSYYSARSEIFFYKPKIFSKIINKSENKVFKIYLQPDNFDEIYHDLIDHIKKVASDNKDLFFVIRPHYRQHNLKKIYQDISLYNNINMEKTSVDITKSILEAAMVISVSSSVIAEATHLGIPSIIYSPSNYAKYDSNLYPKLNFIAKDFAGLNQLIINSNKFIGAWPQDD
jgi:hypothetical protein